MVVWYIVPYVQYSNVKSLLVFPYCSLQYSSHSINTRLKMISVSAEPLSNIHRLPLFSLILLILAENIFHSVVNCPQQARERTHPYLHPLKQYLHFDSTGRLSTNKEMIVSGYGFSQSTQPAPSKTNSQTSPLFLPTVK